jgi:hypothetical protein
MSLPFCRRRRVAFFYDRNHCFHPFLYLIDLGMHFLDKIVFSLGLFFDAFALLVKLVQHDILFAR